MYGKELILDIHDCDASKFTRKSIEQFLRELCVLIDMERQDLHFWDYDGEPEKYKEAADHLKGISCIQFITTSNITIHALDVLEKIFINIFSCKDFDQEIMAIFTAEFFGGKIVNQRSFERI